MNPTDNRAYGFEIAVKDVPACIAIDNQGNDFFAEFG